MFIMNQNTNQPRQAPTPPVFKSEPLEQNNTNLALWARFEPRGAHVTGLFTSVNAQMAQYTTNVNGFFGLSDQGEVRISLKESQPSNGIYKDIGTIYFNQKSNSMKFYPKDKSLPQLVIFGTNELHPEVAKAIGLSPNSPKLQQQPDQTPTAPRVMADIVGTNAPAQTPTTPALQRSANSAEPVAPSHNPGQNTQEPGSLFHSSHEKPINAQEPGTLFHSAPVDRPAIAKPKFNS